MSTKKERREAASVQYKADVLELAGLESGAAAPDTLYLYRLLNTVHHRYLSNPDYAANVHDAYSFLTELAVKIERVRLDAERIQNDIAWNRLRENFQERVDAAKGRVTKLATQLTEAVENSYRITAVLEWSEKTFEAAAEADVYKQVVAWTAMIDTTLLVDAPSIEKFGKLTEFINESVKQTGRHRANSTSTACNLTEDCLRCAWAGVPDAMVWFTSGLN